MGNEIQTDKGLNEKMWEDVNWVFLLSGSNQRVSELAESWVVCIWREGGREKGRGKSGRKEERESNTELILARLVLVED